MKLHGLKALEVRGFEVNCDGPIMISQLCGLHDRSSLHAELRPVGAITTAMSHRPMPDAAQDIERSAMRTCWPYVLLKPIPYCLVVGNPSSSS